MSLRSFKAARWLLILTTMAFVAGCAHKPPEEPPAASYLEDIYAKENRNPDADMFCNAMPPYLQYMENRLPMEPADVNLVFRVAGACYGYAFCCAEDSNAKEASELYLKGRDLALGELRRYSYFDQAYGDTVRKFTHALSYNFDKRNLQALYWSAMNWTGWINLNLDKSEARSDIPKAIAMLEFINGLDASYAGGSVHAAMGSLYGNRTAADGGDPEKARQEFDKALIYSGGSFLAFNVMQARFYATQIQDRALFQKTLKQVLDTPATTYADKAFVNEVARRKAKLLLDNMDRYFKAPEAGKAEGAAAAQ
jgi:hypothetical protein